MNSRIDTKTIEKLSNICPVCEKVFMVWSDYANHKLIVCVPKIKPVKTSLRTKAEIVTAWEAQHQAYIL